MVCYCCYGYNEGDDLSYMQLFMYKVIDQCCMVCKLFVEFLVWRGLLMLDEVEVLLVDFQSCLQVVFDEICSQVYVLVKVVWLFKLFGVLFYVEIGVV